MDKINWRIKMNVIKFVLPVMLIAFTASAEDSCRIYSPKENQGAVVDGVWVPSAASAQS